MKSSCPEARDAALNYPRRFRQRIQDGGMHPSALGRTQYLWGVYFPLTDLVVGDMGNRGTGKPKDVEWLDSVEDIPW